MFEIQYIWDYLWIHLLLDKDCALQIEQQMCYQRSKNGWIIGPGTSKIIMWMVNDALEPKKS